MMSFEELHRPLTSFGFFARFEGPEVARLARFRIFLSRVESVFSGFELANHSSSFFHKETAGLGCFTWRLGGSWQLDSGSASRG